MSEFPEIIPRLEAYSTMRTYRTRDSRYHLKGSRCADCGELYFPPRAGLVCPKCMGRNLVDYLPPKRGVVVTCWVDDVAYPAIGYTEQPPRSIVVVRLEDGIHVISEVVEAEGARIEAGTRVRAVIRKHKREDTGNWVYGYKFLVEG